MKGNWSDQQIVAVRRTSLRTIAPRGTIRTLSAIDRKATTDSSRMAPIDDEEDVPVRSDSMLSLPKTYLPGMSARESQNLNPQVARSSFFHFFWLAAHYMLGSKNVFLDVRSLPGRRVWEDGFSLVGAMRLLIGTENRFTRS